MTSPDNDRNYTSTRPPVSGKPSGNSVAFLPATLAFVAALLGFCTLEVFSVLVVNWRWSVAGVIVLLVGLLVGSCLQSYANRRAS